MAVPNPRQEKARSDLESACEIDEFRWDEENRSPKYIAGKLSAEPAPVDTDQDAINIARKFLDETASLNALPDGAIEGLDPADVSTDQDGFRHVTFQQKLNDVGVFEGSVQVHIDPQGHVVKYKANRATALPDGMEAQISKDDAIKIAAERLDVPPSAKTQPDANLELFRESEKKSRLAWHVSLFSDKELATYHGFVDAIDGSVIYSYNDARHLQRFVYDAETMEDLPGVFLFQEGAAAHPDVDAWNAYKNAGIVYEYFALQFGRNSYDGKGSPLKSTVHFGQKVNNASWRPALQQMVYGDGDGVEFSSLTGALDVVGHELTHAIASTSARFVYAEQSGALDESFADFFGIMVSNDGDITDWKIGEQVYTPRRPGDALRYLDHPPKGGQPDNMANYKSLAPGEFPNARINDNGYVHSNSGIPNKAMYLITAGGTHNNIAVNGMGRAAAERAMFLALTAYLQSATDTRWTFRQARIAMIDACRQLFPGDLAKEKTIMDAWDAVGIKQTPG